ncbi:MAG: molybdopterin synthase catalytic subunit [Saprospiraceae bacterium]|jgi:molybdopterin synthase catalytic subunit
MQRVKLFDEPFEPWSLIQSTEQDFIESRLLDANAMGATANFVGRMRDFNEGDAVKSMTLEHYPGMTESQLEKIIIEACEQHEVNQAFIAHRVGLVHPSDALVLVVCWSAHRKAAFDACREIMETLKYHAPFWKKEITEQGERWVSKNTPG